MSLKYFAAAALAGVLTAPSFVQSAEPTKGDFPRVHELAPGAYAYEGLLVPEYPGALVTTVSLIVVTTDGVVVVDGQGDVPQAQLMVDHIKKLTSQPLKYVVIASDHADHVDGNAAYKAAYPKVVFISSPASKKKLEGEKNTNLPTETVADKRTITLGKTDIQILYLGRAHTGGDLVVYLPQTKVMFMGEVYLRHVFPAMRTAFPTEWLAVIKKARAMDATWYVPGHGFIEDAPTMKRDLATAEKATEYVITESKRLHAAGLKCESPTNCPAAEQAKWGPYNDWALRDVLAPAGIAKVYEEIEGRLPK